MAFQFGIEGIQCGIVKGIDQIFVICLQGQPPYF
jgi:hypothetical protein